jgi:hypothetical protein
MSRTFKAVSLADHPDLILGAVRETIRHFFGEAAPDGTPQMGGLTRIANDASAQNTRGSQQAQSGSSAPPPSLNGAFFAGTPQHLSERKGPRNLM